MIIDTDKIRNKLNEYYAARAMRADKIKDHETALSILNSIETFQIQENAVIDWIENMAKNMKC